MKNCFCIVVLMFLFSSCSNKEAKEERADGSSKSAAPLNQVVGVGKIEPENDIIELSSPVNGIVSKILKRENDTVSEGTVVLELDHELEDGKVKQLESEINTRYNEIKVDEAGVGEFEAKYNNAVPELQRLQRLLAKGAETQQAVDNAAAGLQSIQSVIKKLYAGIAVSKSRLEQAKAALHVAKVERGQKIIKSPVNGKILELNTQIGGSVDTRQAFAQISSMGKTIAVCEIDELYADKVMVGQRAFIRNVGAQDTLSTGTVYLALSFLKKKSLFTDQSGEKEDRRVRTIKIMLDKPDRLLLNARVECVVAISGNLKN